jgi:DNA-binding CsgD family transcriptional regulator
MKLVGRDVELAAATGALDAVRGGDSRVLAVLGEPGIGKSALLAAIAERANGLTVVEARAAEHERDRPFALSMAALVPHARMVGRARLEALAERFGVALDPALRTSHCALPGATNAAERYRHYLVKRAFIEQLGPVVLLLDDVHWADDASLELILHLLTRPPEVPHLLVFALRPAPGSARLIDAARQRPGFQQLALGPLDDAASRALLGDVAACERIVDTAAGVPLFLHELSRSAPGTLPVTLQAAVAREVDALGDTARTLLRGAAVAGDPFDPELAATAAGLDPDEAVLDGLVGADLVRPHAGARGFAFRHPLVRRAVYDATPPAWRLAAHERAAAALQARGADPATRAYHVAQFARAGDAAAIALLRQAAEGASRSSPATAANWYSAALPLLPDAERSSLVGPLALALASAGRLEESQARLHEALALDPGDRELILACARVESLRGRYAQARHRLHAAHTAAPHASLAFELAAAAMTANDVPALRDWAATTERLALGGAAAVPAGPDAVLVAAARVLGALGSVWTGEAAPGADLLDALRSLDDVAVGTHPTVLLHVARALMRLERIDHAAATLKRAVAIGRETASGEMLVWLLGVQAWTSWLQLDLHGALAVAEAAEETARVQAAPNPLLLALSVRAAIHHDRGDHVEAQRAAADCVALIDELEPSETTHMAAATLGALHLAEDPGRCLRELAAVELDPSWAGRAALIRVRAAVATGAVDTADRIARDAAVASALHALPLAAVRAEVGTAEVLLARGEPEAAAALAQAAAERAEGASALDAAEARLLQGRALAALGDGEAAKAVFQRVAADAALGGAMRLRNAASRELRGLGTRVSAHARRNERAELTTREREIAELVAAGHSNKQAAATLYLSEKTIENALTRVYAKLGVRSRAQLARVWAFA